VAEPPERANQPPEEQIVTDHKVEKPDGDQEQTDPDEQNVTDPKAKPDDQEQELKRDAEVFPDASQAELLNQTATDSATWRTQAAKSDTETDDKEQTATVVSGVPTTDNWKLCDAEAGADYIPCLDNLEVIRKLKHDEHYEHRERHCPEEPPACLVPLPKGYRSPIRWPKSRDQVQKFSVVDARVSSVMCRQTRFVYFLGVLFGADMVQQCPPYSVGGVQGAPELGEYLWGAPDISGRRDSVQARCFALH
jgi:hypothetical protein